MFVFVGKCGRQREGARLPLERERVKSEQSYAQKLNLAMECLRRDDWKPVYDRTILLSRVGASPPPPPPPPPEADADADMYTDMFTKKPEQPKRSGKVHQTKKEKKLGRRRKYQESAAAHSAGSASQQAPGPFEEKEKAESVSRRQD